MSLSTYEQGIHVYECWDVYKFLYSLRNQGVCLFASTQEQLLVQILCAHSAIHVAAMRTVPAKYRLVCRQVSNQEATRIQAVNPCIYVRTFLYL